MADQAKDLGLKCPQKGTLYVCSNAQVPFVGCCTTDPCGEDGGICSDTNLLAATFDPEEPPQEFSHECLDGAWYSCHDLETAFIGCCARDACQARCPVKDLRAAVLTEDNDLIFQMASAESTEDSTSAKSTATAQATSTGEAANTLSQSEATTTADIPTGTTSSSGVAEKTVVVPDPHDQNDLSESQEVGVGVTAGVIGFIVLCCIVHRLIVYNRKRRPGYPHRTDHAPEWRPPSSPIQLGSTVAPSTRKCGLDRIPGEATRSRSWEDADNNAAEAKLTGPPGPRRVHSAEPARLLNDATSKAADQGSEKGKVSQHSLPLPNVRGQPVDGPRSVGHAAPQRNRQHRPQGWVTGKEHAAHHGHYSDDGDFSVNIDGYCQGPSKDAHGSANSAGGQHRHLAARSDDQLDRSAPYPAAAKRRPAPLSDGAGRALNLDHCSLKTYDPYTPPASSAG
ncbi:hypothetical protein VUR80DRAFT_9501 [Thermomyces stellatus]